MPSPDTFRVRDAPLRPLLVKELWEILSGRALWTMLLLMCPLIGYSFFQAISLYGEASVAGLQSPVLNSYSSRTRTRVPGTTANASSGNPCREPSAGCVGAADGPGAGVVAPIVSRDITGGLSSSGCWACAFALMPATPIAMPIKNSFPSAFIGPFLLPVAQRESTPAAVGHFWQPLNSFYSEGLQRGYFDHSRSVIAPWASASG